MLSVRRLALILLPALIVVPALDAFLIEPNMIDLNRLSLEDTGNEMTIVFLADFQRRNADPAFVERAVNAINGLDPDLVLLGGDYIDKSISELPSVGPLREIESEEGTYGVLGNHDYDVYWLNRRGADVQMARQIEEYLESDGTITIMRNEIVQVRNATVFALDSYWSGLRDESLLGRETETFRIVLTHNQDDLEIDGNLADLYLFGHTHCGQVRLPVLGSVPKMIGFGGEYDYRYSFVDGAHVYTTCGLTPAPRFLNPPEITIIDLHP